MNDKSVSTNAPKSLKKWYPVALTEEESPVIEWHFVGNTRFTKPFFESTIRSIPLDLRASCLTPRESLQQFNQDNCLEPSALIFHTSRSGSTLIIQLLSVLAQCITISEAPIINSVLSFCLCNPGKDTELLKQIAQALGQKRFEEESHLFIKLDSWHINHFPLFHSAFPNTPCLFVYRNPLEILASHQKMPGMQMVPGLLSPQILGIDPVPVDPANFIEYRLRVLSSFFKSACHLAQQHNLYLINYTHLPHLIWNQLIDFFSIMPNANELQSMKDRSKFHSKRTYDLFVKDTHQNNLGAQPHAFEELEACYKELEHLRFEHNNWRKG